MIESGEMRMHFRYFNVIEYFEAIIEEYRAAADKKSLYLRFIHPDKNLSLFGDKEKIRLVLNNLIQNAIKYTDLGGIEVIIEEEPKFGKITVKDTGIGIPEDAINRVFERFYRIDKGRSKDIGGTGLGLAIVKHIIEAHNSKIEVKSTLNEGTEFSFRLKK
jgi:two-component system phosphate regulon sensor histidine kinase PhoR